MRTFDLSPLFRSSVGFDRMTQMLDAAARHDEGPAYPPYNIEKSGEHDYAITMAVAGFSESDIEITLQDQTLTVAGKIRKPADAKDIEFLHRGIATRAFERRFNLADHIKVSGARMENGLLHVDLQREVPEALKPRKIEIGNGTRAISDGAGADGKVTVIDSKAA